MIIKFLNKLFQCLLFTSDGNWWKEQWRRKLQVKLFFENNLTRFIYYILINLLCVINYKGGYLRSLYKYHTEFGSHIHKLA